MLSVGLLLLNRAQRNVHKTDTSSSRISSLHPTEKDDPIPDKRTLPEEIDEK
jgi:hypothetical protein